MGLESLLSHRFQIKASCNLLDGCGSGGSRRSKAMRSRRSLTAETFATIGNAAKISIGNWIPDSINGVADWFERFTRAKEGSWGRMDPWVEVRNSVAQEAANDLRGVVAVGLMFTPLKASPGTVGEVAGSVTTNAVKAEFGAMGANQATALRSQLIGKEIAGGHAFEKHVLQQGEFKGLGIRTREQFASHIENVVNNPSSMRYYKDGRTVYLQERSGTVVIRNGVSGEGTAFQPENWSKYISTLPSRTAPY